MAEVIPAIIPENFSHLHDEVEKVKNFVQLVQIDIADGQFVKNRTWPYVGDAGEFEKMLKEEMGLPFWEDVDYEFHLMIENAEQSLENWIKIGASGIVAQVEVVKDMEMISELCKANEVALGLSIKPRTNISEIVKHIDKIDFIQCMGSNDLGHHGAYLDETVFEKIKNLRQLYPNIPIAIDIGVNKETAAHFIEAGATKLISGSAIFDDGNIYDNIKFFQNL